MTKIEETAKKIIEPDQKMRDIAKAHLNDLTKPPGSLGRLEELAEEIVFITGNKRPRIKKKVIFTLAGDHGVAKEGVSAFPQEVTGQMLLNFAHGGAAVNVLAKHAGADIKVVDLGVKGEIPGNLGIINKKISNGTENMVKVPAMTRDNAVLALERGVELIEENSDYDVIGTGDMGIANTTASSAIIAVFTGEEVEKVTGRGTGISNTVLQHKIEVIEKAIKVNSPDPDDPIDVLSKVGGYEIGGIAGIILGA
ncbi:MAG: nicotinate-nucleotide--dimethylbenzimidazole phosphoribosyltransferase, partial [Nitrospinota bacterium]|nr:nicotinate-nucleotide--dimethylbenzimidazole phosphoribosyltransferase [Nitrospinota bacterium]